MRVLSLGSLPHAADYSGRLYIALPFSSNQPRGPSSPIPLLASDGGIRLLMESQAAFVPSPASRRF